MKTTFKCSKCGEVKPIHTSGGTGYARFGKTNRKVCYACCAEIDARHMAKHGRIALYLSSSNAGAVASVCGMASDTQIWEVGNWPGTLKFKAHVRKGGHNMARTRYDAWFTGPDGKAWHGVTIGENTQICHCKRLAA